VLDAEVVVVDNDVGDTVEVVVVVVGGDFGPGFVAVVAFVCDFGGSLAILPLR
jgi:hypothetical protein